VPPGRCILSKNRAKEKGGGTYSGGKERRIVKTVRARSRRTTKRVAGKSPNIPKKEVRGG